MKKIALILATILLFSSCSSEGKYFFQDDRTRANKSFEKVLIAIQNKDITMLKSLFAEQAIVKAKDFDTMAKNLFNYFQGDFISYDDWGGAVAGDSLRENSKEWYTIQPTYDVKTSEQEYRFAFKEYTVNEFEPDKVGLWSLYVIRKEDDVNPKVAFRGDGKWTPGIVISMKKE